MNLVELTQLKNDGTKVRMAFPPDKIVVSDGVVNEFCWVQVMSDLVRGEYGPNIKIEGSFAKVVDKVDNALRNIEVRANTGPR